jgi:hypothetical protein
MLTALPTTLFSWHFRVKAGDALVADVKFDFLAEQGTILHRGDLLAVRKHGPLSGHWTLERKGEGLAEAIKPSAFQRRFEAILPGGLMMIEAKSALGNGFDLSMGGRSIGTIRPVHLFTRQAAIECEPNVAERDQLFAFWLVALAWRRAARSD